MAGNEVTVVVGVGGMGEEIARRTPPGRTLLLADYSDEAVTRVADTLGDTHDVRVRVVDVSERESVAELAAEAASLGPVTSVVHTAGLSPTQAAVGPILAVDLLGVAHGLDEFGAVVAHGGAGVIIASMAGSMAVGRLPAELEAALASTPTDALLDLPFLRGDAVPDPGAAYSIAKRANQLRVQTASLAWGRRGARVNSVSPGVIVTPMGEQELQGESGAGMRAMVEASGTGRLGRPEDIAAAVAFLLGPDSSFVTGTDLLVDGGVVAAVRSGALTLPGA